MRTSLIQSIARLMLLPALVAATAVLLKGYAETGDGFSAGIVAAVGLMFQYIAFDYREVERQLSRRVMARTAALGLTLVLLTAFLPVLFGDAVLTHYPRPGQAVVQVGTLELHTAVLFDLGIFLIVVGFATTTTSLIAEASARREA